MRLHRGVLVVVLCSMLLRSGLSGSPSLPVFSALYEDPEVAPINCSLHVATDVVACDGREFFLEEAHLTPWNALWWVYALISTLLVLGAGLFSGLTLAYLSLDMMNLEILSRSGHPHEQEYAKKIIPVVKNQHLLLVTLLLCNATCMEGLPLTLDRLVPEWLAIVLSVTAVLMFGEIIPQAACRAHGLAIGAFMAPVITVLMFVCMPISWPIAKLLDMILGHEETDLYRRTELKELVKMHADEEALNPDESAIIQSTLELHKKMASHCLTPLNKVFMLPSNSVLDRATIKKIVDSGHSRVPLYDGSPQNIVGIFLVKNAIGIDPDDNVPLMSLGIIATVTVTINEGLFSLLDIFQTGRSHMVVVVDPSRLHDMVVGIATLEDVFEEIICEEILDETDVYVDNTQTVRIQRDSDKVPNEVRRVSISAALALQKSQIKAGAAGAAAGAARMSDPALMTPAEAANMARSSIDRRRKSGTHIRPLHFTGTGSSAFHSSHVHPSESVRSAIEGNDV